MIRLVASLATERSSYATYARQLVAAYDLQEEAADHSAPDSCLWAVQGEVRTGPVDNPPMLSVGQNDDGVRVPSREWAIDLAFYRHQRVG